MEILKGEFGVYLRFNLDKSDLIERFEKLNGDMNGPFNRQPRRFKDFVEKDIVESEEFQTIIDRMEDLNLYHKINLYNTNDYGNCEVVITFLSYKSNENKILKFNELSENVACASAGISGMGSVVASQPSGIPGVAGSTGSGDVGFVLNGKRRKRRKMGGPSEVSDARFLKPVKLNRLKY